MRVLSDAVEIGSSGLCYVQIQGGSWMAEWPPLNRSERRVSDRPGHHHLPTAFPLLMVFTFLMGRNGGLFAGKIYISFLQVRRRNVSRWSRWTSLLLIRKIYEVWTLSSLRLSLPLQLAGANIKLFCLDSSPQCSSTTSRLQRVPNYNFKWTPQTRDISIRTERQAFVLLSFRLDIWHEKQLNHNLSCCKSVLKYFLPASPIIMSTCISLQSTVLE